VGLDMKLGDSRPVEIGPLSSKGDTRSGSHPLVSQTQRHLLLSTHPMSRWRGRSRRYNKIEEEHTERDASCHKNRADRPRVGGGRASEQKRQDVEVKRHEERAGEPPVYVDQAKKNHCEKGHSGDCEPRLAWFGIARCEWRPKKDPQCDQTRCHDGSKPVEDDAS
jgi:hypothetical protein